MACRKKLHLIYMETKEYLPKPRVTFLPYPVVYFLCLIFFVMLLLCFDRNFDVFFMQIHSFELDGRDAKQNGNRKNKSY